MLSAYITLTIVKCKAAHSESEKSSEKNGTDLHRDCLSLKRRTDDFRHAIYSAECWGEWMQQLVKFPPGPALLIMHINIAIHAYIHQTYTMNPLSFLNPHLRGNTSRGTRGSSLKRRKCDITTDPSLARLCSMIVRLSRYNSTVTIAIATLWDRNSDLETANV